ncbi:LysE family translocator [Sphingomonas sp. LB3N6]|uniref:LysE family translocator n=1 Tax=Sphingomonas fucosidasi TaxID=3096164 RepID=UPI002FC77D97
MTVLPSLLAFGLAATLLTITPGLDTAMVLRSAVAGGPRQAIATAIGIGLGCLAWGAAVALGLGIVLTASTLAYTILKWAGAAYLLWLGINLVFRPRSQMADEAASLVVPLIRSGAMRRGLLTNLLNPKIGVFYVTFLPQFVPVGTNVALFSFALACIHVTLGTAWFAILIAATAPLNRQLRRPAVVRILDRMTGGVFIGFGVKLALSAR